MVEADVYFASSLEEDVEARCRLMMVLGSVAIEGLATAEKVAAERASLPSVVEDYFSRNVERKDQANARLGNDLRTNSFEILCASGHVSVSRSRWTPDGFYQNGYSQRAMFAHSTLHADHPVERRRRSGETLNEIRIEDGFLAGRSRTHYFIEASRPPEAHDMTDDEAHENGYDTATWKVMLRCSEVDEYGNRITASAPVSGVDKSGRRHDTRGVRRIHQEFKLEPTDGSATGTLHEGFWVRKELLPNGIASLAELYDQGVGGNAFFGVEGQTGDYETIVQESIQREQQIEQELAQRVHDLALSLIGNNCMEALTTMAIHAKDFAADICSKDNFYDPNQFGLTAAYHIEASRFYLAYGDIAAYEQAIERAKETAIVTMCGMALDMLQALSGNGDGSQAQSQSSSEDCEYLSKECPLCHAKNVKTYETAKKITCGSCHKFVEKKPVLNVTLALAA